MEEEEEEEEEEEAEEEEEGMAAGTAGGGDDDDDVRGGVVSIGGVRVVLSARTGTPSLKRGVSHVMFVSWIWKRSSRKATTHLLVHILAKHHGSCSFPASRYRARCKLQDDALAQTLIGKLCEQVPEVFQTRYAAPHGQRLTQSGVPR